MHSHKYFINQVIHDKTKSFKNLQYYLRLPCLHQRLIRKQECVKRHKNHERGDCYYTTRLTGWLTRSGELTYSQWRAKGEQTLLSVTHRSSWRVGWRANTAICHVVARRGE